MENGHVEIQDAAAHAVMTMTGVDAVLMCLAASVETCGLGEAQAESVLTLLSESVRNERLALNAALTASGAQA